MVLFAVFGSIYGSIKSLRTSIKLYRSILFTYIIMVCIFVILIQSIFIIIMIIPSNLTQLVNSYSLAVWIFYGLVFAGLIIMRVTHRDVKRPYKVCE